MFRLIKMIKDKGRWRIFKLKLIDARLYFVSIFVGLLTGLVAVPYHYLLQFSLISVTISLILVPNGIGTYLFFF